MIKRRHFTLLELMVCLALMALVAGFMGVKINDLLAESRYHHSVKRLYNEIETLQALALVLRCDIGVEMDLQQVKIICDEPLLKKRAKIKLDGVSRVLVNGKPEKKIKFEILSTGWIDKIDSLALCRGDETTPLLLKKIRIYPDQKHSIPPKPKENNAPVDPQV